MEESNKVIFELLLDSNGRTTDMLESLCGEKVFVEVIKQEEHSDVIHRESSLFTLDPKMYVSHNFMLLYPDQVPAELYSGVLEKEELIGNILRNEKVNSVRTVTKTGWCLPNEVFDWFGMVRKLKYYSDLKDQRIPFKEYTLHFESKEKPGLKLLEYFNPYMVENRLQKERLLKNKVREMNIERVVQSYE